MPGRKIHPEIAAGRKAYEEQLLVLRKHWPKAFPADNKRVRPLEEKALGIISERMGWTWRYTRGVLMPWKLRSAYCKAVLVHQKRFGLDGKETAELVSDKARTDAQQTLDQIKLRLEARRQREAATAAASPAQAA